MTNAYSVAKALRDYVIEVCDYDYSSQCYSAYGALYQGKTVCNGYSMLYYKLLTEAGIDCRIVTGEGNGQYHSWNYVKIGEQWYAADITWDDCNQNSENFLKGSQTFSVKHTPTGIFASTDFANAYPLSETDFDIDEFYAMQQEQSEEITGNYGVDNDMSIESEDTTAVDNHYLNDITYTDTDYNNNENTTYGEIQPRSNSRANVYYDYDNVLDGTSSFEDLYVNNFYGFPD